MRTKTTFLSFCLMLGFFVTNAQRKADKQVSFDGPIEELFFHEFSGVPVVLTDKTVAGINAADGSKIWEVKGDRISLLGGAIQADESNYQMVPFSPFIIVSNSVIDTRNGNVLLSKDSDTFKKISSFRVVPELKSYLFQCKTDDKTKNKLFLISLESNKVAWSKDITVKKGGLLKDPAQLDNILVKDDRLAFTLGANFFLVDKNDGSVLLNQEEKIGAFFLNPQGNILYAVEGAKGGLGSSLGAAMTLNLRALVALGEKIYAYQLNDGAQVWKKPLKLDEGFMFHQVVDGNLFIQHEKAGSLYDFATGEKLWKKDFEKRNVSEVEKTSEGYMVYYGARKLLVDNNGKKVWKKAQYIGSDYLADVGEEDTFDQFSYSKGSIVITPYRVAYYEEGVKKAIWKFSVDEETRIAYDAQENTVVVMDGKKLYLLNPDKGWTNDNVQKLKLEKHRDFNLMEVRGSNYFLSSPWEYVIVSKDGKIQKSQYYVQPGESGRKWLNALSAVGSVAGAAYQVSGVYNAGMGGTSAAAETLTGVRPPGTGGFSQAKKGVNQYQGGYYGQMASEALYNPNRLNAFAESKDYAFYFTKNKEDKYLVQVSKDNGDELDKFIFQDNKPQYHVDETEKRVFYSKKKELYIFDYK